MQDQTKFLDVVQNTDEISRKIELCFMFSFSKHETFWSFKQNFEKNKCIITSFHPGKADLGFSIKN